nr:IFN-response element binding factor 1 [Mus musculus]
MMERISKKQIDTSERFYMIPKALFENNVYATMMLEAKVAYSILKDRFKLSLKNNWVDAEGNVFLIYKNKDLQKILGVGEKKVISIKKELTKFDLLEEERQGLNRPNKLYIGNLDTDKTTIGDAKPLGDKDHINRQVQNCQNDRSGTGKMTGQELSNRQSSDTEYSDTELSNTETNNHFDDEIIDVNSKSISNRTIEEDVIKCGELIGSNTQIRGLVQKHFGDMLVEDPKMMVEIIETLIKTFNSLETKIDQGNQSLVILANKLGRDEAVLFILNKVVANQLEYMRDNLVDYAHFAAYFAKGLSNRVNLIIY